MTVAEFVARQMDAFDALPTQPARVLLTDYQSATQWSHAPERPFSLEDARRANQLLAEALRSRGVEVTFRPAPQRKLDLTFILNGPASQKNTTAGNIGWAVLSREKYPEK